MIVACREMMIWNAHECKWRFISEKLIITNNQQYVYQEFSVDNYIFGLDNSKHMYKNHITYFSVNKSVYINKIESLQWFWNVLNNGPPLTWLVFLLKWSLYYGIFFKKWETMLMEIMVDEGLLYT